MDLVRLYEQHDCVRSAEKIDNPNHRALLLKTAEQWRQAAQALRQSIKPSSDSEVPGKHSRR